MKTVKYDDSEYILYSIRETDEPILIHVSEMERIIKLYIDFENFTTAPDSETVDFISFVYNPETNVWEQSNKKCNIKVNLIRAEMAKK